MFRKLSTLARNELALKAAVALTVKVVGAAGAFLLNVVIAQFLGAEQAGYFFLAQAILVILSIFIRQGLDNALVRYIAGYRVDNNQASIAGIYHLALTRVLPLGMLSTIVLWFCSDWVAESVFTKPPLGSVLAWSSFAIVPIALSQLHGFCFQGQKRIAHAMFFESAALSSLAILIIWIMKPVDADSTMQLYLSASIVVCGMSFLLWNRARKPMFSRLEKNEKRRVSDTSKSLFTIVIMAQVTQWAGQLTLGAWSSAEDVALFSVAQRTAMLTAFILIAVNAIAAPKFAEAYKQGDLNQVRSVAKMSGRLMTICALPIVGFMMFFAPWLMSFFGEEFIQGADVLRILALGQFINVITGSVGYLLQMTGYEKIFRNNVITSSLITIVGSVVFIPVFGLVAAAWVTTIAIATQNLLCVYQVKKNLGFNTLNIFSR
ncbi:flippase [Vibrio fortis]|uniref:flippase n=1 Tax=Vibrio fortis TaxID=212667 RepID=UPI0021C35E3F|nr:flippase [Vibrio fortis]